MVLLRFSQEGVKMCKQTWRTVIKSPLCSCTVALRSVILFNSIGGWYQRILFWALLWLVGSRQRSRAMWHVKHATKSFNKEFLPNMVQLYGEEHQCHKGCWAQPPNAPEHQKSPPAFRRRFWDFCFGISFLGSWDNHPSAFTRWLRAVGAKGNYHDHPNQHHNAHDDVNHQQYSNQHQYHQHDTPLGRSMASNFYWSCEQMVIFPNFRRREVDLKKIGKICHLPKRASSGTCPGTTTSSSITTTMTDENQTFNETNETDAWQSSIVSFIYHIHIHIHIYIHVHTCVI